MKHDKCPICGLDVIGDVIAHLKTKEHEIALKVLLEKEADERNEKIDRYIARAPINRGTKINPRYHRR